MSLTNFGRNITLTPKTSYSPKSEEEVLEILDRHRGQRIRVVGRLHSWSRAIETDDVLLDLRHLNQVEPEGNDATKSVVVGAGCQIKRLLFELKRQKDWTLPSVGFITEQTVGGAISTGTHGSGKHSLSHYVLSVRIARYDSQSGHAICEEIRYGAELQAARCSLGCLGVILCVRMECRTTYAVEEFFEEHRNLKEVIAAEVEYPLQQFYLVPWRWTYFVQHRRELDQSPSKSLGIYHWYRFLVIDVGLIVSILVGARILKRPSIVRGLMRWIVPCFVIRKWRVVGPSDRQLVMENELFCHIEIEYFVQKRQLHSAMEFLTQVLKVVGDRSDSYDTTFKNQLAQVQEEAALRSLTGTYTHHFPICVRKILTDDTLISMASPSGQVREIDEAIPKDAPSANEHWYAITLSNFQGTKDREAFVQLSELLARSMSKLFGARPHWGKLCPLTPSELRDLYPSFNEFQKICNRADPEHRFRNRWTDQLLGS